MTNKQVKKAIKEFIKDHEANDLAAGEPKTFLITEEELVFFAGQIYGIGQGNIGKIQLPDVPGLVEELGWYATERSYDDKYVIKRTLEETIKANKLPKKPSK
jgi:hypothetical protein